MFLFVVQLLLFVSFGGKAQTTEKHFNLNGHLENKYLGGIGRVSGAQRCNTWGKSSFFTMVKKRYMVVIRVCLYIRWLKFRHWLKGLLRHFCLCFRPINVNFFKD